MRARASRLGSTFLAATLAALASVSACSCETDPGLQSRTPALELLARPADGDAFQLLPGPKGIDFGAVRVGEEALVRVELSNSGAADLVLNELPTLQDGSPSFELRELLTAACAGASAGDGSTTYGPGTCAALTIVFKPGAVGAASDHLVLVTNDPANGTVKIPLNGAGTMPDAVVCAEQSCTAAGTDRITLDFGQVAIGARVERTVTVRNAGDLPLELSSYQYQGSPEFTITPAAGAQTIAPAESFALTVVFAPIAGGPRTGVIALPSDDPDQATLFVDLVGTGDAGHLEVVPFPVLDFGPVEATTSRTLPFTVTNTGSQPVTLSELTLLANGEYSFASALPTLPLVMAPSDTFEVQVTFTAPEIGAFPGRVKFVSDEPGNQSFYLGLSGEGSPAMICELHAQIRGLDFGQTVQNTSKRADLVFSNNGLSTCEIPAGGVVIAAGNGGMFRLAGIPPPPILVGPVGSPSALLRITVEYVPADLTGPDTGTLTVTPTTGSAVSVPLSGTPVETGTCQLEVVFPSDAGFFGRVLNFGSVRVLRRKEMQIILQNRGAAPCTVNSATKAEVMPFAAGNALDFSISGLPGALPIAVQPGAQAIFSITFRPQAIYQYITEFPEYAIRIQTNDLRWNECNGFGGGGQPGCLQVSLAGEGVDSVLEIVPERLDFGDVTVGCASREKRFTVYNIAADGMQVTDITIDPPNAPFVIVSRPNLPLSPFNAGSQFSVAAKYRPQAAQADSAQVLLTTDDGQGNTDIYAVPLTGTGTFDAHQTDTFQVSVSPKTDVLWIVDNSGSMSEEQGELDDNARTFLDLANAQAADYRMVVITTDVADGSQNGKFQGSPKIIDPSTPNPGTTLGGRFGGLGTNGSGDERGLQAVHSALTEPLISDVAQNAGFLRADAKLAVIVVSDEEDGSAADLDFYEDFFWSIKGRRNTGLFTFNSVVGDDPSGCTSGNGDAVSGSRYIEMSRRTGGIFQSICAQDWGLIANNLGLNVFTPISEFRLSREADSAAITVTVDSIPQAEGAAWSYDSTANAVVFTPGREPGPGATVVVDYDTYCGP